ncbi:MAG: prepilin-type N-terminal cleavage/methylation domain-containing protein [Phycisphaera sp.]|nr:prepilin-type N-terminal cleavage/methylation domain-containing protein [Phycisphaera sp.]
MIDRLAGRTRCARGFTIVEMLVVLAIIVLLLAIMLPSMQMARANARTLRCQVNERQLLQAQQNYASDNYTALAHPNWLSKEDGDPEDMKYAGWLYKYPDRAAPKDVEKGALWQYLKDIDVYRCLDHPEPWEGTERITSYCLNGSLVRFGNTDPQYYTTFRLNRWQPEDIFFWETHEESHWWNDGSNFPSEFATGRHPLGGNRGAGNVGMMCGAVKWLSEEEYLELSYSTTKNHLWNVPDSTTGR